MWQRAALITISPFQKNQLDDDLLDRLRALLGQALGDRFEKVYSAAERRAMAKMGRR